MDFGWKILCSEISTEKCISDYSILPNKDKYARLTVTLTVYFSISICWIYTGIDASECAYCEVFDGLHHVQPINIFKNPINQRSSKIYQIHTTYFVNTQDYDFSNKNRVGPGPISIKETQPQSFAEFCLEERKILWVTCICKQRDCGCPVNGIRECWVDVDIYQPGS